MQKRGFEVQAAQSVAEGLASVSARPAAYAVVDLRLEDGNGLDVVERLRERRPDARIVVLTGYGAIATAVAAVKIGATDYLSKPADATISPTRFWRRASRCRRRLITRCRRTGSGGSISSAFSSCATAMCPKRPVVSTCIDGRCSAFWRNGRPDEVDCPERTASGGAGRVSTCRSAGCIARFAWSDARACVWRASGERFRRTGDRLRA